MSDEFVRVAKVQITQRKYQEAVRTCRRGLLEDSEHLEGRLVLGMALMALRRYGEVRAEMALAIRVAPTHPVGLRLLGEAYLKEGDLAKAEASLRKALHSAPADAVTRELLVELEEARRGETEETTTVERWFDVQRSGRPSQPDFQDDETTVRDSDIVDDFEQGVETRVVDAETAEQLRAAAGLVEGGSPPPSVLQPSAVPDETTAARPTVKMRTGPFEMEAEYPEHRDTLQPPAPSLAPEHTMELEVGDSAVSIQGQRAGGSEEISQVLSIDDVDGLVEEVSSVKPEPVPGRPAPPAPSPPRAAAPAMAGPRPSAPPPRPRQPTLLGIPAVTAVPPVHVSAPAPGPARAAAPPSAPPPMDLGFDDDEPETVIRDRVPAAELAALATRALEEPTESAPPMGMTVPPSRVPAVRPSAPPPPPMRPSAPPPVRAPVPPVRAPAPPPVRPSAPPPARPSAPPPVRAPAPPPVRAPAPAARAGPLSTVPDWPATPPAHAAPGAGSPPPGLGAVGAVSTPGDRLIEPYPAARGDIPSMPPTPPDADPFGRVAIPAAGAAAVDVPLIAGLPRRRKRSTAVFLVGGVVGGAALLAAGIFLVRGWSREGKRSELVQEALLAEAAGSEADLRKALAAHEAILETSSGDPELRAGAALAAAWLAVEYEDAAAASRAESLLTGLEDPALAQATEARALLLLRAGRVADAKQLLDSIPQIAPRGTYAKALVAMVRGERDVARGLLEQATAALPGDVRATALLAENMSRLGDSAGAFQRLQAVDPTGSRSRIRLARARSHLFAGSDAEAMQEADALLALAPAPPASEVSWAELVRASVMLGTDATAANGAVDRSEQGRRPWDFDFATTRARVLLALGRPREARQEAERAASAVPERAEARVLLAEAALASGDLDAAAAALAAVPASSEAAVLAGDVALARGDLVSARTRFEEASGDAALAARAKTGLARVAVAEGNLRQAWTLIENLPAGEGGATVFRAELLWSLGRDREAREALESAGGDPAAKILAARIDFWTGRTRQALDALRALVGAAPSNVSARVALAEVLLGSLDVAGAGEQLSAARALAPASPDVLLADALLAAEDSRFDDAEQKVAAAEAAGAIPWSLARAKGRVALGRRQRADAVAAFREALRGAPRDPWIHVWMGKAQLLDEQSREALVAFGNALEIDSRLPEALVGRALANLLSGSLGAVGDGLERAERALSDHPREDRFRAQMLYVRGRFHWENGNYEQAMSLLRDATGKDQNLAEAFAFLGYAIVDGRGPEEEGCAAFARYLDLAGEGPEAGEVRRLSRSCR